MTGTVKWFSDKRGYGFIEAVDCPDLFVHYSDIISLDKRKTLKDGQSVSFETYEGNKGPKAIQVEAVNEML